MVMTTSGLRSVLHLPKQSAESEEDLCRQGTRKEQQEGKKKEREEGTKPASEEAEKRSKCG